MNTAPDKKAMWVLFGLHSCCFLMMATVGLSATATRFSLALSFITIPVTLWFWIKQIRGTIFVIRQGRRPRWPMIRNYLFLIAMTAYMTYAISHHLQHSAPPDAPPPADHVH